MGVPAERAKSDITKANEAEEHRHRLEKDAIYIATAVEKYDSAERAYIRRRVQELLRCNDEPAGTTCGTERSEA